MPKFPKNTSAFKMKGSPYHKNKQTDAEFIASAEKQKSDAIANLTKKAISEGLDEDAAKKAAEAAYKRNI